MHRSGARGNVLLDALAGAGSRGNSPTSSPETSPPMHSCMKQWHMRLGLRAASGPGSDRDLRQTSADAPLIDAETLFRSPGPLHRSVECFKTIGDATQLQSVAIADKSTWLASLNRSGRRGEPGRKQSSSWAILECTIARRHGRIAAGATAGRSETSYTPRRPPS